MFIKQLGVRAGFKFSQSPTKEKGLSPTCDVTQLVYNGGLTWKIVDFLSVDATYFYLMGLGKSRDTSLGGGMNMSETFETEHHVLLGGLRFQL